jgi:tRNA(adenine34) deaminase
MDVPSAGAGARGGASGADRDAQWMREALALARQAAAAGDVPVGAVVVGPDGTRLGAGCNRIELDGDPTAHAEMVALRAAARTAGSPRLVGATLYVTLEPCAMCAGAMVLARVERLVYGAGDPRAGACGSLYEIVDDPRLNHRLRVTAGCLAGDSSFLLRSFFESLRRR